MKYLELLIILVLATALIGCENPELTQCQQNVQQIGTELAQATETLQKVQQENEKLEKRLADQRDKSRDMQTKAMEGITKMLTKQAGKEKEIKQDLKDAQNQLGKTTDKLSELAKENMKLKLRVAELEKTLQDEHQTQPEPEHEHSE